MARNERETRRSAPAARERSERPGSRDRDRDARRARDDGGGDRRSARDRDARAPAGRPRDRDDEWRVPRKVARGRGSKRPNYVYKPRSPEAIRERGERQGGSFDSIFKSGVDTWRAKVGDNLIRFLPPTWDNYEHYGYKIWVHKYVGADESSYLCLKKMLGKRCPICEAEKDARDAGENDEAKHLAAREDFVCWIIDRDNDPDKPMLFQMSWMMDRDIASICYDKRRGDTLYIDHHEKGYDVTIKRQGTGLRTRYYGFSIDREPSPINDDEAVQDEIMEYIIDNPVPSMLNYYSEAHLQEVMSGTGETRDEELDEEETAEEERPRVKKRRTEREEEPETEEAFDEEGDEKVPDEEGDEEVDEESGDDEEGEEDGEAYDEGEEGGEEDDSDSDTTPRRRAPPAREREPARARGRDNGGGRRQIANRPSRPAPAQRSGRGGRSSGAGRYRD